MKTIPDIYRRFWSQILYFVFCPIFFFLFILVYSPFDSEEFFNAGRELFALNVTIYSTIILVLLTGSRLALYYIKKMSLNWQLYLLWCLCEIVIISFFGSLYMNLIGLREATYFNTLGKCLVMNFEVLLYPYIIVTLLLLSIKEEDNTGTGEEGKLLRIQDENHKVKLVIAASAVIYVESEENYIRVYYSEGDSVKDYQIRSSMKQLEENFRKHGIIRCHRSYYINPKHIKVLRKNPEGIIVADLFQNGLSPIPVSKRYYDNIADLL